MQLPIFGSIISNMHRPIALMLGIWSCADPAEYYEHVFPSDWKPETPETWIELHRRAYCGHADIAFPVLFFAMTGVVCFFQLLSPGLLLAALPVFFILGLQLLVISGNHQKSCSI